MRGPEKGEAILVDHAPDRGRQRGEFFISVRSINGMGPARLYLPDNVWSAFPVRPELVRSPRSGTSYATAQTRSRDGGLLPVE